MTPARDVTTWFLEMLAVSQLQPAPPPTAPHRVEHVEQPTAGFARYLYRAVGAAHWWTDRLPWSNAAWEQHLQRRDIRLYTLQLAGAPIGYFELEEQPLSDVQITYLGLLPEHQGRGWGGLLLTRATQLAWQLGDARRVWVHTCTLDGPAALANYLARGFQIFRQKTERIQLAPVPLGADSPPSST